MSSSVTDQKCQSVVAVFLKPICSGNILCQNYDKVFQTLTIFANIDKNNYFKNIKILKLWDNFSHIPIYIFPGFCNLVEAGQFL